MLILELIKLTSGIILKKVGKSPGGAHREYILRAAVLLVTGALTINPESIFSGNIA